MLEAALNLFAEPVLEGILGIVCLVIAIALLPVITFGRVRVEPLRSKNKIKFRWQGVHRAPDGTTILEIEMAALIGLIVAGAIVAGYFILFR
jgi:hypothetical protein